MPRQSIYCLGRPISLKHATKYGMEQFVQILLMVTVVYLTLRLSVKTMFGEYTNLFAAMTAMLVTCMVVLTTSLS